MAKRALIMAGGGLKVGFQAGVLQVWMDEAGVTFDHADGASGGCFNLAMYCQGMSGKQIADNWRNYDPFIGAAPNFAGPGEFAHQQSFFTLDAMRQNLFPKWGLDWNKIRAGTKLGTFNLCNFSKKRLEVVTNAGKPSEMYYLVRTRKSIPRDALLTAIRQCGPECIGSADVEIGDALAIEKSEQHAHKKQEQAKALEEQ